MNYDNEKIQELKEKYEKRIGQAIEDKLKESTPNDFSDYLTGVQLSLIDVVADLEELLK